MDGFRCPRYWRKNLNDRNVKVEDKKLLLNWYYEDKNQIPISFIQNSVRVTILIMTSGSEAESNIRRIFQNAIENLDDALKAKFITSATESEAIEGITLF